MPLHPQLNDLLELRHQAHTVSLASHRPVNSVLCGLYASVFRGQGMNFEEVREYREGDEIRNMDWRVTARTGVPHLKVFREERQRSVILAVDIGPAMQFGTRSTFKSIQAARAAALLGWAASSSQDRVGGLLFGDAGGLRYFRPSRERRALWRLLSSLTEEYQGDAQISGDPLHDALDKLIHGAPTGALILLAADFNRESHTLEQKIGRLRQRQEIVLFPVDDPADWELPAMGRVVFTAPDGSRLEIDTDSEPGRAAYRHEWETRRAHLQVMCKRLGVDLIPLYTYEDVHRTLVAGLRRRMRHVMAR
jgi:uncharacterized protein (DUF58 family)